MRYIPRGRQARRAPAKFFATWADPMDHRHGLVAAAFAASMLTAPAPAAAREVVHFAGNNYSAGTIVVRTQERRLYFVLGDGKAIRYPVGVGKAGKRWSGTSSI